MKTLRILGALPLTALLGVEGAGVAVAAPLQHGGVANWNNTLDPLFAIRIAYRPAPYPRPFTLAH